MKVLLLNPPSASPQPVMPLGLAFLAAALRDRGVSVEIIDAWVEGLDFKGLEERIARAGSPEIIGVTVMSPTSSIGLQTVRVAKKASPKSITVAGGTHPSALPEQCLEDCPELDMAAIGEGELLLLDLVDSLSGTGKPLSEIKGLVYRDGDAIKNNGPAEVIKDLNDLPFPAVDLLPILKYRTHPPYRLHKRYATMITSRGCPFHCTYCTKSVSGQNYRYQTAERVVAEMESLINTYGIEQIHFYDDDFTITKKRVEAICDLIIAKGIRIDWSCVTRVDLVDERLLQKMRRSGCWLISYGVESGNQAILDSVRKGYRIADVKEAFRLTKAAGIRTLGYFMAGFPGETLETLQDTVDLSLALDPDFVSWSITALYPGSELYRQAVRGELPTSSNQFVAPRENDSSSVSSLSPFAHGHALIYEGKLPRSEVLRIVNVAYRRFYFRIPYLLRFFAKLRTVTEFSSYVRTFFQFLTWQMRRRFS